MEKEIIKQNKTQKFIKKLYTVVNDTDIPEIVWANNGTTILIPNKDNFKAKAMKKISKAKEYTAFLRSLHHYNFTKLKRVEEEADEYYHKCFMQGREDLLPQIKRVKDKGNNIIHDIDVLKQEMYYMQSAQEITQQHVYTLKEKIDDLQKTVNSNEQIINLLISILSNTFRSSITNDETRLALKNDIQEISNLLNHKETATRDGNTRKYPKLEHGHTASKIDLEQINRDYKQAMPKLELKKATHAKKRPNNDSMFLNQQSLIIENNLSENTPSKPIQHEKKKVTEITSPKIRNIPVLEKENNEESEELFDNLFF